MTKRALLLGMVYSLDEEHNDTGYGQCFRDMIRCRALETLGYEVYTLDDKHASKQARVGRHCCANFADTRRCISTMKATWPDMYKKRARSFDVIIMDYFFSPSGWIQERWTENMFKETLVALVEEGMLSDDSCIWLPHVVHIEAMLEKSREVLEQYFTWEFINSANSNPLFAATEKVERRLNDCKSNFTNATQIASLRANGAPFYVLKRIPALTAGQKTVGKVFLALEPTKRKMPELNELDTRTLRSGVVIIPGTPRKKTKVIRPATPSKKAKSVGNLSLSPSMRVNMKKGSPVGAKRK